MVMMVTIKGQGVRKNTFALCQYIIVSHRTLILKLTYIDLICRDYNLEDQQWAQMYCVDMLHMMLVVR